ncbi:MAG TPA: arginyltransferase [Polyangia bacterium]|nr:arginyltransferase [Polyangia bacterium]
MSRVRVLLHAVEKPRPCSYLPGETASLEVKYLLGVEPAELEAMLARGWRRFGLSYFRPACAACHECVPLRVPVATFAPSRSQRRAAKACADLRVEVGPVQLDDARLALYAKWHADREDARGWDAMPLDAKTYTEEFALPIAGAREVTYWDDDRLVAVGLCDETPGAWSAIYFFYDPAEARRSLGAFHIQTLVALARSRGQSHVYLGYRIERCPSMAYKAKFTPHELLEGRPSDDEAPRWR